MRTGFLIQTLNLLIGGKGGELSGLFHKVINPIQEGSALIGYLPRPHLLIPSLWGWGFNISIVRGHKQTTAVRR